MRLKHLLIQLKGRICWQTTTAWLIWMIRQCSFGGYDDSLRGYVILYALSNVAEILYFTVWFYVFYHKHYTPIYMHLLQILIAISLEMPLMCTAWCMLQGLPGKVNYDDVFWDMILLATFLCNAWLSMCFKLWDILSDLSTIQDRGFSPVVLWFFKLMGIIIMSSFHTIFVFTPIVYITGNFRGIAKDNDTQNLMEILRFPGKGLPLLTFLFTIPLQFYISFFSRGLYYFIYLAICEWGWVPRRGGTPIHYLYGYVPPNGVVILKLLI